MSDVSRNSPEATSLLTRAEMMEGQCFHGKTLKRRAT